MREDYANCYFTTDDKIASAMKAKMGTLRVYQPKKYTSKYEDPYKEMNLVRNSQYTLFVIVEVSCRWTKPKRM